MSGERGKEDRGELEEKEGTGVAGGKEMTQYCTLFRSDFTYMNILFLVVYSGAGNALYNSEVPDTITTWNAEAFAINTNKGLGISPLVQLTVKKELFVSLELPYSIIFKETVTVTPIIHYFGSDNHVTVSPGSLHGALSATSICVFVYIGSCECGC